MIGVANKPLDPNKSIHEQDFWGWAPNCMLKKEGLYGVIPWEAIPVKDSCDSITV